MSLSMTGKLRRARRTVLVLLALLSSATTASVVVLDHLDARGGMRLDGVEVNEGSGQALAMIGDVNGDGFGDFAIGAPDASPSGVDSAGRVYVIFGSANALQSAGAMSLGDPDGSNGFRIEGAFEFDGLGTAVAAAGDVNGDGIADMMVGSFASEAAHPAGAGSTYVVFGRSGMGGFGAVLRVSELDGNNGFRIDGENADDFTGMAIAAAGDVNADGIDDLLLGAASANPDGLQSAGSSYVVFGRSAGQGFPPVLGLGSLDGSNGFRIDGASAFEESGETVAAAGDVNGDGIGDLIIGAPRALPGLDVEGSAGSAYVVFGRPVAQPFPARLSLGSLDGANGFRIDGAAVGDSLAMSVAGAGDVNGDGVADVIVGAPGAAPAGIYFAGSAYVVFGRSGQAAFSPAVPVATLDGSNGFHIAGERPIDLSGISVGSAGDINADGIDDLWVTTLGHPSDGSPFRLSVIYGRTMPPFAAVLGLDELDGRDGVHLQRAAGSLTIGPAVAGAADVNGDGIPDLLMQVGPRAQDVVEGAGTSFLFFGPGERIFGNGLEAGNL